MLRLKSIKMNGVFAVYKPSGITSAKFIERIQNKFTKSEVFAKDLQEMKDKIRSDLSRDRKWKPQKIEKKIASTKVKIGHGGTLDPLASGILVVGVGLGTKKLQYYLAECQKTYETKALLGISTTTGIQRGKLLVKTKLITLPWN